MQIIVQEKKLVYKKRSSLLFILYPFFLFISVYIPTISLHSAIILIYKSNHLCIHIIQLIAQNAFLLLHHCIHPRSECYVLPSHQQPH